MEEQTFERPLSSSQPIQTVKKKRSPWILLVAFILLIILIIFLAKQFSSKTKEVENASITPTPEEEFQWPSETPTPEVSLTEEPTNTPKPKPTSDPVDKETGLDRSELNIEVLNGSGEKLVGSKGSEVLKSFGYHIVSVGNADNFDYENVTIEVKKEKNQYLTLLKKDLGASYTIGTTSEDLSASVSADARVIIGK